MPGTSLLEIPYLDKIVHVILFAVVVLLWGFYYVFENPLAGNLRKRFIAITIASIILGIIMEFIQLYLIPNRDFDTRDIIADALGALAAGAYLITKFQGKKQQAIK